MKRVLKSLVLLLAVASLWSCETFGMIASHLNRPLEVKNGDIVKDDRIVIVGRILANGAIRQELDKMPESTTAMIKGIMYYALYKSPTKKINIKDMLPDTYIPAQLGEYFAFSIPRNDYSLRGFNITTLAKGNVTEHLRTIDITCDLVKQDIPGIVYIGDWYIEYYVDEEAKALRSRIKIVDNSAEVEKLYSDIRSETGLKLEFAKGLMTERSYDSKWITLRTTRVTTVRY